MATLSDYMSGTISLANGSATVTGTGTLFEATKFREGDTLQIQNLTAVIASVDSDTQLTLTEPWTGLDIVDGAYRARQLGDGSRVSTQAATIIELLGNGVLMNLAELGVEEGKAPVGGPTGEYELVDKSTFGVQDPNGSLGKLAALTLAARQILQTDENGMLAQSPLGLFGQTFLASADLLSALSTLGPVFGGNAPVPSAAGVELSDGNFNTINVPGVYTIAGTWSNGPNGTTGYTGILEVKARGFNNLYVQTFYANGYVYRRFTSAAYGESWPTPWEDIGFNYGSNSNGVFIQLPGKVLICFNTVINTVNGSANWTFPRGFSDVPVLLSSPYTTSASSITSVPSARSASSVTFAVRLSATNASSNVSISAMAIGLST